MMYVLMYIFVYLHGTKVTKIRYVHMTSVCEYTYVCISEYVYVYIYILLFRELGFSEKI